MASAMTSREFNQHTHRAKIAAQRGPVIVTERGRPAHVLLTYASYVQLTGRPQSLAEALTGPAELADIDLSVDRPVDLPRDVDFT